MKSIGTMLTVVLNVSRGGAGAAPGIRLSGMPERLRALGLESEYVESQSRPPAKMKNDRLSETTQDSTDNGKVPGSRELGRSI